MKKILLLTLSAIIISNISFAHAQDAGIPVPDNDTARCLAIHGSPTACLASINPPIYDLEGTTGYTVPAGGCNPDDQDMGDGCCLRLFVSHRCELFRKTLELPPEYQKFWQEQLGSFYKLTMYPNLNKLGEIGP